ncbi:MAG: hypothetical protein HRU51_07950 [Xanthomonadales bacterium]|nr:hypothetical protein [Xanthomonadales bacterium]
MSLFKSVRVLLLLLVLLAVASNHWLGAARLASWEQPIWITVYPLAADQNPATQRYMNALRATDFDEISRYLSAQARRYGRDLPQAARFQLAPPSNQLPPALPADGQTLAIAWWSLRMRWWAWRQRSSDGLPTPDIQVFMQYRTAKGSTQLDRSVGLQKGRYTLVQAYASRGQAPRNRLVMTHELLHVLGATDKYVPGSGLPLLPQGLARPEATPLFPQREAELMAGAIALSPTTARRPASLAQTLIGAQTAREIGWLAPPR